MAIGNGHRGPGPPDQGKSVRNGIIGIVIGIVIGVVVGATVVAPRLNPAADQGADQAAPQIADAILPKAEAPLPPATTPERDKTRPAFPEQVDVPETPEVVAEAKRPAGAEADASAGTVPPPPEEKTEAKPAPVPLSPAPAPAEPPAIRWKMGSAYASTLPQLGTLAKKLDRDIWRVSDGRLEIKFHEPGALVPPLEMFDAVRAGVIDAAFSSPGFWGNKVPALQLFAAVPFGPSAKEYLAWIYFGGGKELFELIYHANGIHSIFCGLIAPEASGWFRDRIRTVEDLKGLKMRFFGLGAKVMQKLGVATTPLTDGDIFVALETGAIDAVEFSMPAIDLKLGFHRMAKNYYFPGWHQPATMFELMINLEKWNGLPVTQRAQVEAVCGDNIRYGLAEGEAVQFAALKELQAQGVVMRRWPGEILDALRDAWAKVVKEEVKADDDFKRVWKSLSAFREDYSIWRELSLPY